MNLSSKFFGPRFGTRTASARPAKPNILFAQISRRSFSKARLRLKAGAYQDQPLSVGKGHLQTETNSIGLKDDLCWSLTFKSARNPPEH